MDKDWIKACLSDRVTELNKQIKQLIVNDQYCKSGKSNAGRVRRSLLLKDRNICLLMLALIDNRELEEDEEDGLQKLCEPRRFKCS